MKARKNGNAHVTIEHELSPDALQFLELLEEGLYLKEIAVRLGKTESQIKHLRQHLGVLFGARTNRELLAKARSTGLLHAILA